MAATATSSIRDPFQAALNAAEALPPDGRRRLAARLLFATLPEDEFIIVPLRRLSASAQTRLKTLMDRSNEGKLSPPERNELVQLVEQYEYFMLANTRALLQAVRPELFTSAGRLVRRRLKKSHPAL